MGINISSNYIPAININTGVSVLGALSVSTNSFYDVTNYQTVNINIIKLEDFLETRLVDSLQLTSYSNDNLIYIAPYTFSHTGVTSVNFPMCTSIGYNAFQWCTALTSISFPACKNIGTHAFNECTSLTTASFPVCTTIGVHAFNGCTALTTASFPACKNIGTQAFISCTSLTSVSFPICTTIGGYAFQSCYSLTTVSFPTCTNIDAFAFRYCYNLLSLYLMGSSLCSLTAITAFTSTPISTYTTSTGGVSGSIYVPASLYNSYITATNWTTYSSRFVSV